MQRNPFKGAGGHSSKIAWNRQESGLSRKEKEWGTVKFSPVIAQPATPWAKFKTEITQKQQEEGGLSSSLNMKSKEAKNFLKKREENYRRLLIAEAQKGATKWEDFSEELDQTEARRGNGEIGKHNNFEKQPRKKSKHRVGEPTKSKELISKKLLNNFDSRKLTFDQNNTIRKVITKTTHLARSSTLKSVVEDLKKRGLKRKRANNTD